MLVNLKNCNYVAVKRYRQPSSIKKTCKYFCGILPLTPAFLRIKSPVEEKLTAVQWPNNIAGGMGKCRQRQSSANG